MRPTRVVAAMFGVLVPALMLCFAAPAEAQTVTWTDGGPGRSGLRTGSCPCSAIGGTEDGAFIFSVNILPNSPAGVVLTASNTEVDFVFVDTGFLLFFGDVTSSSIAASESLISAVIASTGITPPVDIATVFLHARAVFDSLVSAGLTTTETGGPLDITNLFRDASGNSVILSDGYTPSIIVVSRDQPTPPSDTTPPVVSVPGPITVDPTSQVGAVVTFSVTATDPDDAAGPVTCSPASGSTFPIGTTTVSCTSTDSHGNTGTNGFSVTVLSPTQVVSNLIATVTVDSFQQASKLLQNVLKSVSGGNTSAACGQLSAFINQAQAQSGKALTADQASQLIQSANDAKGALGCPR